ncbi:ATP synthase subunit b [Planctomycetes bacterium MalM25]|nr:ATP synthase subunit b [Planctomycetes bacterium MalM25]
MLREWLLIPALAAGLCLTLAPSVHADDEAKPAVEETTAEDDASADESAEEESDADKADEDSEAHGESDSEAVHEEGEHGEESHDSSHGASAHGDEAHGEGHAAASPDPLATDPDLAWWTAGVFFLMLAILSQIAWKPIMEGLAAREEGITSNLAAADAKHEEAKALLEKHQQELAGAADQVRELLEEARRDADTTMAQAKADAKHEFELERERAMRDIDQAKDAAVRQLAERTAGMAIDLAGNVVKSDISSERQSEIVREALGRFVSSDPSNN